MPELVDVEGFREVAGRAEGSRICDVVVHEPRVLRDVRPGRMKRVLVGHSFGRPWRHGKWLVLPIDEDDAAVLMHFGMTARLVWCRDDAALDRHDRVEFVFDTASLRYRDQRKLAGLHVVGDASARGEVLGGLGPDASTVSCAHLRERLDGRRGGLKSTLTDQHVVAGLGNLLVDEILWRARLHPRIQAAALDSAQIRRLHERMLSVLRAGSKVGRVPDRRSWLTGHRDRPGDHCPRCGTGLERLRISGRTTVCCPHCQPERA